MKREQEEALIRERMSCSGERQEHCITCSDEALSALVLQLDPACSTAVVELADGRTEVDISLLDVVVPGDRLLVHGGVAIGVEAGPALPEHEVHDVHA